MAYDWKKGATKFAINAGIVIGTGLITLWQNDVRYMALVPLIQAGLNWLKHR